MELAPTQIGPVATVLDPRERQDVERAGAGLYRTIHRDSVQEVLRDLRQRRVSAVLLSALRCTPAELPRATRVVREFPRIPAVVLVSRHGEASATSLLAIGSCGMNRVIDVRAAEGWNTLRTVLSAEALRERDRLALQQLMDDLADAPEDMTRFVVALFDGYTGLRTVRELAHTLEVDPSTLMSRFFRARLPAPKRYLVFAGLVRAARLFENPGFSVADVANHLAHSSAQSFGRHVRTYLGISAGEFRQSYDGTRMMQRFRDELIRPYQSRLRRLSPLVARPRPIRSAIGALAHSMAQRA
jgi:AraC-like DNA-binding protein